MRLTIGSLASGSSGNCYLITSDTTVILVDAGISGRQIFERLKFFGVERVPDAVLITHEHSDHILGLPSLEKRGARVFANEKTLGAIKKVFSEGSKKAELFKDQGSFEIFETGKAFMIGDITVNSFPVSHDAVCPCGFSFSRDGACISIVTDTGYVTPECYSFMIKSDILVLESNHDESMLRIGRYPWFLKQRILGSKGHLSNDAAAMALVKVMKTDAMTGPAKRRRVLLAHLSKENNFPQMALATMHNILEAEGFVIGRDLEVETLSRTEPGSLYVL